MKNEKRKKGKYNRRKHCERRNHLKKKWTRAMLTLRV